MDHKKSLSRNPLDFIMRRIEQTPAGDRFFLRILFFIIIGSLIFTLFQLNNQHSTLTATKGGTITEAVLGTPRFVNPVLANTRADQDVTALVYSGLLTQNQNGDLVPELASNITTSDDGLTYTITLKQGVQFHDGEELTAEDVLFTIQLAQDPDLKSPIRGNWTDVVVEQINDYELQILLEEPYAPFIENFTLGIMPAHLWSSLPIEQLPFSQLNTEPVGTGPYQLVHATRDPSGVITSYELEAFAAGLQPPNIQTIFFTFFTQESDIIEALKEGTVDASAYVSNANLGAIDTDTYSIKTMVLPRIFGVFFNQNRSSALLDDSAREALSTAIDRNQLIDTTLAGYGVPISSPTGFIPVAVESTEGDHSTSTSSTTIEQASTILAAGDWEQNELGFWEKEIDDSITTLSLTLRTSNTPLFANILEEIATTWRALGVEVATEQFEQTGLVQSVIRPRDFQALLFGLDMSRSYDLYPFWHSSQKDDPGLNIAQYTNLSVDELLEEARLIEEYQERNVVSFEASEIIASETPAVFLFQPEFVYVVNQDINATLPLRPNTPTDRFEQLRDWHTTSAVLWAPFRDEL